MVIKNGMKVAEGVARIIMDNSYRLWDSKVHDLMLFGSTLNRDGKDLDMLVIHGIPSLTKYGTFSIYDSGLSMLVPDFDSKIEDKRYSSQEILKDMGTREIGNLDEARSQAFGFLADERSRLSMKVNREISNLEDVYKGAVYIQSIDREFQIRDYDFDTIGTQVDQAIEDLRKQSVFFKVGEYLKSNGLNYENLDLHVMHRNLLFSDKAQEERSNAIKHCRDSTFWSSVLESGRLYDNDSGKFSGKIRDKYPDAIELFKNLA